MRFEETKHIGAVMSSWDFEGTPDEIAKLKNLLKKPVIDNELKKELGNVNFGTDIMYLLSKYNGEYGEKESVTDTLRRLLNELDAYRLEAEAKG